MIWTKGTHQSPKFQTFDCSHEILPNLHFERLLLLNVYKISAKKYRWFILHDTEDWWKIRRKFDLLFQIFLLCKVCNLWAKNFQRSYVTWNWRVMQNFLKKNYLWFGKWYEEYRKFSPQHLKNLKIEILMVSFHIK